MSGETLVFTSPLAGHFTASPLQRLPRSGWIDIDSPQDPYDECRPQHAMVASPVAQAKEDTTDYPLVN